MKRWPRPRRSVNGVTLLNVDPGADTNRTVITFVGEPEAVLEGAFQLIEKGVELIDMTHASRRASAHRRGRRRAVHPRLRRDDGRLRRSRPPPRRARRTRAERSRLPLRVRRAARRTAAISPTSARASTKAARASSPIRDWPPDFGPAEFVPRTGAIVIGARKFLVAYNVNLNTLDKRLATRVAFDIRERGRMKRDDDGNPILDAKGEPMWEPGLLKSVKAVGWVIPEFGCAQVSINLTDLDVTPLHVAFDACEERARERGLRVTGSEIVGLVPRDGAARRRTPLPRSGWDARPASPKPR